MAENIDVPLTSLLVDQENPRLATAAANQPTALSALAKAQGDKLIKLATDLVAKGMNPLERLAVMPDPKIKGRYIVLDGNRRVTALKGLETPTLIKDVLTAPQRRKLLKLAETVADRSDEVMLPCRVFEDRDAADHWIQTLHGGELEGVGRVRWGTPERERYNARRGERSVALQISDLVAAHEELLEDEVLKSKRKIHTSLDRALRNPEVRSKLGVRVEKGKVVLDYPLSEVLPAVTRLWSDLKLGKETSRTLNTSRDLGRYAAAFPIECVPQVDRRLVEPVSLADAMSDARNGDDPEPAEDFRTSKKKGKKSTKGAKKQRKTLVPKGLATDCADQRVVSICKELKKLDPAAFPNACAVLLRVILELSVNDYIRRNSPVLSGTKPLDKLTLTDRMNLIISDLKEKSLIEKNLELAMRQATSKTFVNAASTVTLNQYVHNPYVFPTSSDLIQGWDQLQPFLILLWKP